MTAALPLPPDHWEDLDINDIDKLEPPKLDNVNVLRVFGRDETFRLNLPSEHSTLYLY